MLSLRFILTPYISQFRSFRIPHPATTCITQSTFPTSRRNMSQEYKLKDLSSLDLQPSERREVEVEGIENAKVLLVNVAGKITALSPRCTHYGGPLLKGVLTGSGRLTCPWHGGELPLPIHREKKKEFCLGGGGGGEGELAFFQGERLM